jgi:CRISPR-associated protein Cas1
MYFGEFSCMFKNRALSEGFDFNSRNRRPPKDPVNSLLSFGYALLAKEFTVAIDASGLDPMHGYYHAGRSMRPALALDLMEPFRPLISDSLAITCINRGMLKKEDFVIDTKGCHMKSGARKKYLEAYENRLNTKVSYNGSGAISYRNAIRKAIQDFKSYILDKSPAYMPLVVR